MKRFLLIPLLLATTQLALAWDEVHEPLRAISMSELAAESDLVALAQVKDTDYEYTRSFPSGGTAFLQILIPYKGGRFRGEIVEIHAEGLHENECYFENPTVFEEGRRHLVFLKFTPDAPMQYEGHEWGCALEIFVTRGNMYALKYPVSGIGLSDEFGEYAREMDFSDRYAYLEEGDLPPGAKNDLLDRGLLVRTEERLRYTYGIALATARKLMGQEALAPNPGPNR